jgi:hypothetical protein
VDGSDTMSMPDGTFYYRQKPGDEWERVTEDPPDRF